MNLRTVTRWSCRRLNQFSAIKEQQQQQQVNQTKTTLLILAFYGLLFDLTFVKTLAESAESSAASVDENIVATVHHGT